MGSSLPTHGKLLIRPSIANPKQPLTNHPSPTSSRVTTSDHAPHEEYRESNFDGAVTNSVSDKRENPESDFELQRRPGKRKKGSDNKMPSVNAIGLNYAGAETREDGSEGKPPRQHPAEVESQFTLRPDKDNEDYVEVRDDWPFATAPRYCRRCNCCEGCRDVKLSPSIRRKRRSRRRRPHNRDDHLPLRNPRLARRLFSPEPNIVARTLFGLDLNNLDIALQDEMSHLTATDASPLNLDESNVVMGADVEWVIDCRVPTPTR